MPGTCSRAFGIRLSRSSLLIGAQCLGSPLGHAAGPRYSFEFDRFAAGLNHFAAVPDRFAAGLNHFAAVPDRFAAGLGGGVTTTFGS